MTYKRMVTKTVQIDRKPLIALAEPPTIPDVTPRIIEKRLRNGKLVRLPSCDPFQQGFRTLPFHELPYFQQCFAIVERETTSIVAVQLNGP